MQNISFNLILESKIFNIPCLFDNLVHINPKIFYTLINDHSYQVQSTISESIFQSFIDYLIYNKVLEINDNNVDEFSELNQEFKFEPLDDLIEMKKEFDPLSYNFKKIDQARQHNQDLIEEEIAINLDYYIHHHYEEMYTINIERIIRIFNHPKRKLIDHEMTYHFLSDYFANTNKYEVFSLISTLDASKLKKSTLLLALSSIKSYKNFPRLDIPDFFNFYEKAFQYLCNENEIENKQQFDEIKYSLNNACKERDLDLIKWLTRKEIEDKESGFSYKIDNTNKTAAVYRYLSKNPNASIPRSIKFENQEYLITTIISDPSHTKKIIQNLKIVENSKIIKIGDSVFSYGSIKNISIPASVKYIGDFAFNNCSSLETIIFPINSNLQSIGYAAFENTLINRITIPSKIKKIYNFDKNIKIIEFAENSKLQCIKGMKNSKIEKINIPSSCRKIEQFAFSNCINLKTIDFAENTEKISIENFAFYNSSLESISFPSGLIDLHLNWCEGTFNLRQIKIPELNDKYKFENGLLIGKTNENYDKLVFVRRDMKTVVIPKNIKVIASSAFSGSVIEEVFIPQNVIRIEKKAFSQCKNLRTVEIDENSKYISFESEVFNESGINTLSLSAGIIDFNNNWCSGLTTLTEIKIPESNKRFKYENGFLLGKTNQNNDDFDKLIFANRNITTTSIPSNIKKILSSAFSECKNLKKMNLLNTELISIGESSFKNSSVEELYIPSSVTNIEHSVFSSCKNLHTLEIPEESNLQFIGNSSFCCSSLKSISIPQHVKEIAPYAFMYCKHLKNVNISHKSELIKIGEHAFEGTAIESFIIPPNVSFIGPLLFNGCNELKIIDFSNNVKLKTISKLSFYCIKNVIIVAPKGIEISDA